MPSSLNKPPTPPTVPPPLLCPSPPPLKNIHFQQPVRRILTPSDLALFQSSQTHTLIMSFIKDLNNSVLNLPLSHPAPRPAIVDELISVLDAVDAIVDRHPAEEAGGSRFGNAAFRGFYDEDGVIKKGAIQEIKAYFAEAFGNRTRIDYGSGHELNYLIYLLCLRQLSLLPPSTYTPIVLHLFTRYLTLMRRIQTTYYLEPAGSHGVWGLDDYQFLPFLFGSSQLYSHPYLRPKCIHDDEILEQFSKEYIYLSCISFINSIKVTAGLRWHSPMLDDISNARNWAKINGGMMSMYEKEVLGKLPIMQHFLFGGLVSAVEGMGGGDGDGEDGEDGEREVVDREGMTHVHSTWGECCGIKVPAAIGARKAGEQASLRKVPRIPFD
ncbi:Phosphotyrosyl phosphatase activator [Choiromyces venosus 120613-1]|uniref:Serine/threonine-protein phosphatase 2A activator n=1 Tax=Choiromyces venosus 120613-1 TaxID=1336337 RepID=A0A3N4JB05_9PEZI|nr:Phosphotyrosyl phosphatase activator [Choiromyces venosus 120613-1]